MARNRLPIAAVAVVVAVGGFAARALFFGDAPREVELAGSTSSPDDSTPVSYEGTWTVDKDFGTFDEEFTSTYAGYRISEQFAGIGANTAVGRTPNVDGTMTIEGSSITAVNLTVDMTTLKSDRDRRDNALRTRGLETNRFPQATFKLTQPIEIADEPEEGEEIDAQATGDLTLHGVTKRVTAPIQAKREGHRVTIASSLEIDLDDYNIERPTTARVVSIADKGTIELQVHFVKSS